MASERGAKFSGRRKAVSKLNAEDRVAVVLCADIVGYSRLMGTDEEGTHATLTTIWRDAI